MSLHDITSFSGEHRFLSNFWFVPVHLDGVRYPSVEHAYQAAKTLDKKEREVIRTKPTPAAAKRAGRNVTLRSDWNEVRLQIMANLLTEKFRHEPLRSDLLLKTGDRRLIENNTWGDTYWGVCRGVGQNNLGRLLMAVRERIKEGVL